MQKEMIVMGGEKSYSYGLKTGYRSFQSLFVGMSKWLEGGSECCQGVVRYNDGGM